jgi:hypothetical protein
MTDRELLEFAAKAARLDYSSQDGRVSDWRPGRENVLVPWNPLDDDGDALRLAVKLGIIIEYRREIPACFAYHYNSNLEVVQRNDQLDPYAATRRAIVRAAAEIGRNMA